MTAIWRQEGIMHIDQKELLAQPEVIRIEDYGQRRRWPSEGPQRIVRGGGTATAQACLPLSWSGSAADLEELVVVADALRALQRSDGGFVSPDATEPLFARSHVLIDRLLSNPMFTVQGVRVEHLPGGIWTNLRTPPASGTRPDAYLHWGPLATWRAKSNALQHSFVLATADREMDALVGCFDEWALSGGAACLSAGSGCDDLRIAPPPQFLCARVVLRGGEAAIPPYHFAYFFPEDEGVAGQCHSALVFTNGYSTRLERISLPIAHRLLGVNRMHAAAAAFPGQLLWLRAHDICHSVHVASTSWDAIARAHGPTAVAVLGEVIADVFGYLLVSDESARSTFGLGEENVALSFIAEMLHYLRREAHLFPDSAAACVELNYLVRHEHLSVNEDLSLDWSPQSLRTGFEALAQELVQAVLGGVPEAAGRFLGRYGCRSMPARGATRIEPLLHMLSYQLPHIPTIATA